MRRLSACMRREIRRAVGVSRMNTAGAPSNPHSLQKVAPSTAEFFCLAPYILRRTLQALIHRNLARHEHRVGSWVLTPAGVQMREQLTDHHP
jgi:hypothetical protein